MRRLLPLLALVLVPACTTSRTVTAAMAAPSPTAPYTPITRAGGFLFLSGRLASDSIGRGIRAETQEILAGMQRDLQRLGATMNHVTKCTVFLMDIAEWGAMNEGYAPFFTAVRPARTAVQVAGLPRAGRLEIECIAVAP